MEFRTIRVSSVTPSFQPSCLLLFLTRWPHWQNPVPIYWSLTLFLLGDHFLRGSWLRAIWVCLVGEASEAPQGVLGDADMSAIIQLYVWLTEYVLDFWGAQERGSYHRRRAPSHGKSRKGFLRGVSARWNGGERTFQAEMRQRMMYLGKAQTARSMLLECKMRENFERFCPTQELGIRVWNDWMKSEWMGPKGKVCHHLNCSWPYQLSAISPTNRQLKPN